MKSVQMILGTIMAFGLFFTEHVWAEKFVKHGNNGTVSCAVFCAGVRWGNEGDIGSCVPPAINTRDSSAEESCDFSTSVGPELTCTCDRDYFINYPLNEDSGQVELGDHRRMSSTAILSKSGRLDVTTRTWTDKAWEGFTGGVSVFFLDRDDNVLGATNVKTYGVDGKNIPGGTSDTGDQTWPEAVIVPSDVLKKVAKLNIRQEHTPKNITDLIKARIDDVCGAAKKVTSTGQYCP